MSYPYKLHEFAHREYIATYEWYELRKEGLGDSFMQAVEKKLKLISKHPEYYSRKKSNFREAKVTGFPYVIVYEFLTRKKQIHIAAIYHSKRNPRRKYRRQK